MSNQIVLLERSWVERLERMSDNHINYEELAQEALRGVIRSVMSQIEELGELPGEHHFFIAFDTQAPDVDISPRLKEQYPEEMTIVLQHQFWDLKVHQDYFEVKLSFNNVLERLVIPYKAIKVFFDPSVTYGLQFGSAEHEGESPDSDIPEILDDKGEATPLSVMTEFSLDKSSTKDSSQSEAAQISENPSDETTQSEEDQQTATVVSLDTFRKK